jgi:hypothetical protein
MIGLRSIVAFKNLIRMAHAPQSACGLTFSANYNFAFMQLFERNKKPAELSSVFKRETSQKGHIKSKAMKHYSTKLNENAKKQSQKLKNHKGLLKRVKIVAYY